MAAVRTLLPGGYDEMGKLVMGQLKEWTYEAGEEALDAMADDPDARGTSQLIDRLAMYFQQLGAYDRAEPLFEEALAARRRTLGDEHPDTLTSMNNLGMLW